MTWWGWVATLVVCGVGWTWCVALIFRRRWLEPRGDVLPLTRERRTMLCDAERRQDTERP